MYGQITMRIKHTIKLFTITCLVQGIVLTFSSCATTGPKLKADVIGFADSVATSYEFKSKCLVQTLRKQSEPYDLLKQSSVTNKKSSKKKSTIKPDVEAMKKFVDALPQNQNTAAYYALDLAIDRVRYVRRKKSIMGKDPFSKYYIITLTDGLDNISTQVARNTKRRFYNTQEKYEARLKKRMKKATKNIFINFNRPCDFAAYCMVFKGIDLQMMQDRTDKSDAEFDKELKEKMKVFTGNNGNVEKAPEVLIDTKIDVLFDKLRDQFKDASFEFQVPKSYANDTIRMMLVNEKDDTIYVEGLYKRGLFGKCKLKDVKVSEGVTFAGQSKNELHARNRNRKDKTSRFCLNTLKLKGQHFYTESSEQMYYDKKLKWTWNTEYRQEAEIIKNAYVIFLIDGSDSFKDKFKSVQFQVKEFIDDIAAPEVIKSNKTKSKSKTTSKSKSKKQSKK